MPGRDSVCPKCGKIGRLRLYRDGHGRIYERMQHWDGDVQYSCHIGKRDKTASEVVGKTK